MIHDDSSIRSVYVKRKGFTMARQQCVSPHPTSRQRQFWLSHPKAQLRYKQQTTLWHKPLQLRTQNTNPDGICEHVNLINGVFLITELWSAWTKAVNCELAEWLGSLTELLLLLSERVCVVLNHLQANQGVTSTQSVLSPQPEARGQRGRVSAEH